MLRIIKSAGIVWEHLDFVDSNNILRYHAYRKKGLKWWKLSYPEESALQKFPIPDRKFKTLRALKDYIFIDNL